MDKRLHSDLSDEMQRNPSDRKPGNTSLPTEMLYATEQFFSGMNLDMSKLE